MTVECIWDRRASLLTSIRMEGPPMGTRAHLRQPAAPRARRVVRTARGLRVFAIMVGVAIVSGRSSGLR